MKLKKTKSKRNSTLTMPAWLHAAEPSLFQLPSWPPAAPSTSMPCAAQAPVEELIQQVALVARKVDYLQTILFKVMAELIRSGNLDENVLTWLDCDLCKKELADLVSDSVPGSRRVN
jgi:hypothetical protein